MGIAYPKIPSRRREPCGASRRTGVVLRNGIALFLFTLPLRQALLASGKDLYCITAEQVLGLANVQEKSPERQLGKVFELGLGYQMGPDRLLAPAKGNSRCSRSRRRITSRSVADTGRGRY
jgi:hypothetical protein